MSDISAQTIVPLYSDNVTTLITTQLATDEADETWLDASATFQVVHGDHAVLLDFSYYGDTSPERAENLTQIRKDIVKEKAAVERLFAEIQRFRDAFVKQADADLARIDGK
jgi:hypothetical protein